MDRPGCIDNSLDGDADLSATVGTNLADAVGWLLLLVPGLLFPLGILAAALVTAIARRRAARYGVFLARLGATRGGSSGILG
jgi:hypothetical protein